MAYATLTCLIQLWVVIVVVSGHGYLMDPPGRSSMWRYGYNTPPNYNDNQLSCGGAYTENYVNKGKCGICGDAWDGPRLNEAGGKYANGIITKTYQEGQAISARIMITANHMGWFEFKVCPNNDVSTAATHECLDAHPLELANGRGSKFYITSRTGVFQVDLVLPAGLTCSQCVLQWRWHTGNSWGVSNGRGCVGCGPQEEFYGCSDIAITGAGGHQPVPPQTHFKVTEQPHQVPVVTDRPVPQFHPRPTSPPTERQTQKPAVTERPGCFAVNNWAGIPRLDTWCRRSCARGHCPAVYCRCSY